MKKDKLGNSKEQIQKERNANQNIEKNSGFGNKKLEGPNRPSE